MIDSLVADFKSDLKELKKMILKALIESDFKRTNEQVLSLIEGYFDIPFTSLKKYVYKTAESFARAPKLKTFTEFLMKRD